MLLLKETAGGSRKDWMLEDKCIEVFRRETGGTRILWDRLRWVDLAGFVAVVLEGSLDVPYEGVVDR